jgi:hypothetical protein
MGLRPIHQFVVLAYGDSPFLPECLASVCEGQGGSSVLLATSTPSAYITEHARARAIEVRVGQSGRGIAADWNFGLESSSGEIVTFAHQDDVYYPGFAELTCTMFETCPTASLCFTDYEELGEEGDPLPVGRLLHVKRLLCRLSFGRGTVLGRTPRRALLLALGNAISGSAASFNMRVLEEFRFSEDFSMNLDWEAWWRLHLQENAFCYAPKVVMGHRIHSGSTTSSSLRNGRRSLEDQRMFEAIWPKPVARTIRALYMLGY